LLIRSRKKVWQLSENPLTNTGIGVIQKWYFKGFVVTSITLSAKLGNDLKFLGQSISSSLRYTHAKRIKYFLLSNKHIRSGVILQKSICNKIRFYGCNDLNWSLGLRLVVVIVIGKYYRIRTKWF